MVEIWEAGLSKQADSQKCGCLCVHAEISSKGRWNIPVVCIGTYRNRLLKAVQCLRSAVDTQYHEEESQLQLEIPFLSCSQLFCKHTSEPTGLYLCVNCRAGKRVRKIINMCVPTHDKVFFQTE